MKTPARIAVGSISLLIGNSPQTAMACAACFGESDSPLAAGLNAGIFTLMVFVVVVLAGIAAFCFFLARQAISHALPDPTQSPAESTPARQTPPRRPAEQPLLPANHA